MKITIPMNEQTLESGVCPSFGRAPYFLLYDTDTSESQWIVNSAAENAEGRASPRRSFWRTAARTL
jgi:predicted Fe-Mo cluster-binding NifX family protein